MKDKLLNAALVVFALLILGSGGYLGHYYLQSSREQGEYTELAERVQQARRESTKPAGGSAEPSSAPQETTQDDGPLPELAALAAENGDLAGWLRIGGTAIDYPVMQTGQDDPDHYLKRNFYGEKNSCGCIYAQWNCDLEKPSDNVVLYGHNMKNGSMFAGLMKYQEKSFYEQHPSVSFDTLTEHHTYEIIAVFKAVAQQDADYFGYHHFVEAKDEAEFEEFMAQCRRRQLYDTGRTASFGDKLLTLSTCEYSRSNGRMVVLARRTA